MKRLILSVAILAVAASCSQNEVVDVVSSKNLIGFSTLNSVATKSATENKDDYQVYAHLTTSPSSTAWYIDTQVTDANKAAGTYYWPESEGTLDFFAYAPVADGTIISDTDNGTIGTSVKVTATADGKTDFTIATPLTGVNYDTNSSSNTVALKFAHQFAKVNIEVVLSEDLLNANYSIDLTQGNIAFGVAEDTGVFTLSKSTPTIDLTTGSDKSYSDDINGAAAFSSSNNIIPQSAIGCTIDVSDIKILKAGLTDAQFEGTLDQYEIAEDDVDSSDETNKNKFVANKQYNITLTISSSTDGVFDDGTKIEFSAEIADWTTTGTNPEVDVEQDVEQGTNE